MAQATVAWVRRTRGLPKLPSYIPLALRAGTMNQVLRVTRDSINKVRACLSINFLMRSNGFQEDCFRAFALYKLKNDPEVIACAASPGTFQFAPELVSFQQGVKSIFCQEATRISSDAPGFFLISRRAERTKELERNSGRFMKVFPIKYHPGSPA